MSKNIREVLDTFNQEADAAGSISVKVSVGNVTGTVKEIFRSETKMIRGGDERWLKKVMLSDDSGEIRGSLWSDTNKILNTGNLVNIPDAQVYAFHGEPGHGGKPIIEIGNKRGSGWEKIDKSKDDEDDYLEKSKKFYGGDK